MTPVHTLKENYGIEIALVVLCCRIHFNTAELETLEAYCNQNRVDWEKVMYLTAYHRIEPIVFKVLNHVKNIPGATTALIKHKQLFLIQQNFKQALETERIIQRLNDQGIECYPYKGVAFSKQFYGDITSRESSDIDLVVPEKDFEKILGLLKQDGYSFENRVEYEYYKNSIYAEKNSLNFNKYNNDVREFHVEFHWRITENIVQTNPKAHRLLYQVSDKELIIATKPFKTLEINAHYLAVFIHHANHDTFTKLKNLMDLCQVTLIEKSDLNNDLINKYVQEFEMNNASVLSNLLSDEILGIRLPFTGISKLNNPVKIKNIFMDQLLSEKQMGDHFKTKLFHKTRYFLKDNKLNKMYYLLACLKLRFSPAAKDLRVFKLPRRYFFLYPLIKPFRSLLSPVDDKEEKTNASLQ